jgi:hypothetical protein
MEGHNWGQKQGMNMGPEVLVRVLCKILTRCAQNQLKMDIFCTACESLEQFSHKHFMDPQTKWWIGHWGFLCSITTAQNHPSSFHQLEGKVDITEVCDMVAILFKPR